MMTASGFQLILAAAEHHGTAAAEPTATAAGSALGPVLGVLVAVGVFLLLVAMLLCLYRVIRGPHLADRVLAADTLALQVVGVVLLLSVSLKSTVFFDMALVLAILGFVSTVAFSQYIYAKGGKQATT